MKKKIGILFGGKSGEHEISLMSGAAVLRAIDKSIFEPVPLGIDKEGNWFILNSSEEDISDAIEKGSWKKYAEPLEIGSLPKIVDFVFPALHGVNGEDGTVQGLLDVLNIPYGGCDVLASAVCMDKITAKELFKRHDIPTSRFIMLHASDLEGDVSSDSDSADENGVKKEESIIEKSEEQFSYPVFVKPSNGGSSLGITKALNRQELKDALRLAAKYDSRILIEEAIDAREIETAVIGNRNPKASTCGEIIAADNHRYYDYDAKYSDDSGTLLVIPADVPDQIIEEIREMAIRAYKATACTGFARVDSFWDRKTGRVLVNEINTIPGLTKYSLFPRLWEAVGVSFTELITEIVELGYERCNDKNNRNQI